MKKRLFVLLLACFVAAFFSCSVVSNTSKELAKKECTTALEVINRNLDACGGLGRIEKINTLIIKGKRGSVYFSPSETTTYYLQKPDKFKLVGLTSVVLNDGDKHVWNTGTGEEPLPQEYIDESKYFAGFYSHGCSLLKWKPYFSSAEFVGLKQYGPDKEYVVRFPNGQAGKDITAHIDAETFLIDRLVYQISHPQAKVLRVVHRLREYKNFGGITMPTYLVSDKVGWEVGASHLRIDTVRVNAEIDGNVFAAANFDLDNAAYKNDRLTGKIQGVRYNIIYTNISDMDLETAGIKDGEKFEITLGGKTVTARYARSLDAKLAQGAPPEMLLGRTSRENFPRCLLIPGPDTEIEKAFSFESGDPLIIRKIESEE